MSEDEMKERWCPFTRVGEEASGAAENRPDGNLHCVGSYCAAWRWTMVANPKWQPQTQMGVYPPQNPYSQTPSGIPSSTDGYCGLAGRP